MASRKDLLPTVLPSLWGKVSDGNLLSTTFVKTKVQPATFVWSNVMMAIFAQSNGAAGHLRASERAAGAFDAVGRGTGDLGGVDRVAAAGGESRGRRPRRRVNDDRDEGVVDVRKWCCRSLADDRAACPPRLTVDRAETLLTTFS